MNNVPEIINSLSFNKSKQESYFMLQSLYFWKHLSLILRDYDSQFYTNDDIKLIMPSLYFMFLKVEEIINKTLNK